MHWHLHFDEYFAGNHFTNDADYELMFVSFWKHIVSLSFTLVLFLDYKGNLVKFLMTNRVYMTITVIF